MFKVSALLFVLAACGDNLAGPPRVVGTVFADVNGDGVRDATEEPLAGLTMFVDLNDNGARDGGEPQAQTAADGTYEIAVDEPGNYNVRQVLPFGFRSGLPSAKPGFLPIIGGSDAFAGQYGFMVAVGAKFDGGVFQFCGGVLITD